MRRVVASLLFITLASVSCDKREEPLVAAKPPAPPATSTSPVDSTPDRCMVPSQDPPPPDAESAENCPTDPVFGGVALPRSSLSFPDAPTSPTIDVELALTPAHRTRGLMYRTTLPENAGMLFYFPGEARVQSFWMRNTCIPLDMLFITQDGFIAGILENVPTMSDAPRSIPCPVNYVLEVNAGWTRKHGVFAGQRAELPPEAR